MKAKVGDFVLIVDDTYTKKYNNHIARITRILKIKRESDFTYKAKVHNSPLRDVNEDYFKDDEFIVLKAKTLEEAKDEVMVILL